MTFKDARHCHVATVRWTCPYTGQLFTDPGQLDVGHMVPLENARASGGWAWDAARKEAYAKDLDDPEHLVAVYRGANRSKGSKGPERWMPTNQAEWCSYGVRRDGAPDTRGSPPLDQPPPHEGHAEAPVGPYRFDEEPAPERSVDALVRGGCLRIRVSEASKAEGAWGVPRKHGNTTGA